MDFCGGVLDNDTNMSRFSQSLFNPSPGVGLIYIGCARETRQTSGAALPENAAGGYKIDHRGRSERTGLTPDWHG